MLQTIDTERLHLRELQEKDAEQIFFLRSDPGILKYIDIQPATTVDDALAFIKKILDNAATYWCISLKGTDELIGTICIWNINAEHFRAEIGFAMHPAHQGRGLMAEAIEAVCNYAFTKMQLHSLEGRVHSENIASMKTMEKNGFVKEAHFKEDYFCKGRFNDTVVYSKITPLPSGN